MESRVISVSTGRQVIRVRNIYQHPEFDPVSFDSDISILELKRDLIFNQEVNKLSLPAVGASTLLDMFASVTSFGSIYEERNYAAVSLATHVNIVSKENCREAYHEEITDNMICACTSGDEMDILQVYRKYENILAWQRKYTI